MKVSTKHWTERSVDAFRFRIAMDFVTQLTKRMDEGNITQTQLAKLLDVTKARVSQIFSDPSCLSLRSIVGFARALQMKVSIVAYDDNDPANNQGPINSEIFNLCWNSVGKPRDFFNLAEQQQAFTHPRYVIVTVPLGKNASTSTRGNGGNETDDCSIDIETFALETWTNATNMSM